MGECERERWEGGRAGQGGWESVRGSDGRVGERDGRAGEREREGGRVREGWEGGREGEGGERERREWEGRRRGSVCVGSDGVCGRYIIT